MHVSRGRRSLLAAGLVLGLATRAASQADQKPAASQVPTISDAEAAGHRLWILVFDISSISATDLPRAKQVASRWIASSVGTDDYVAVVTAGAALTTLENFTTHPDRALAAVSKVAPAPVPVDGGSRFNERDFFNNDLRYRELRDVCTGLQRIVQKKAVMFFTASRERPGPDNQAEVRAATEACNRANASVNPIDVAGSR